MKIGIFDSGLGGLLILKAIRRKLPQYDYIYLGDTKRVPYGNRSQDVIYEWTKQSIDYLFRHNCELIILACNTASVQALRRLQQEYLPTSYPNRRVLGVVVPTIEAALERGYKRLGVLATRATVNSKVYEKELRKKSRVKIFQQSAPLLVPIIEEDEMTLKIPALKEYLEPLQNKNIDGLILGCTHYVRLKTTIAQIVGPQTHILSQDTIIPKKLKIYLSKHSDLEKKLSRRGTIELLVTEITPVYEQLITKWFGRTKTKQVHL